MDSSDSCLLVIQYSEALLPPQNRRRLYGNLRLALDWFQSYLSNRSQHIKLSNAHSNSMPLQRGVPQCSLLSPTLFNNYTNPSVLS